ncbi:MAG: cyclic nucleotide-binding domain-containing protein [Phycisphaerales bacterium]
MTSAPTNQPDPPVPARAPAPSRVIAAIQLRGEPARPEEIEAIPLLTDAARFVAQHPGCIRRRTFARGEVICTQGEAGRTAYYLLSGSAIVHLESRSRSKSKRRTDLWSRVKSILTSDITPHGLREREDRPIAVDASAMVSERRRLAVLGAGSLFGEIACLTRQPRSATVTAAEPCEVLEIIRTVLDRLRDRSEAFRAVIAEADRRKLAALLRVSRLFRDLSPEAIDLLRARATSVRIAPGENIFRQWQAADALYVIRVGQVRVSQLVGTSGEVTICYLGEGDVFGEDALLEGGSRPVTCTAYGSDANMRQWYAHPVPRAIRSTAVEVFRIARDDCLEAFRIDPRFRRRIESLARRRKEKDRTERLTSVSLPVLSPQAEAMGLPQGQRLLLIDLDSCTRCDQCVQACVAAHDDGLPRLVREGPRIDHYQAPSRCRSCLDPVCMIGCPVGSIGRKSDFSMFIEDWCIGCGICASNCPYGSIQLHDRDPRMHPVPEGSEHEFVRSGPVPKIAAVCDQCHALPTGPACQYACPHDSIVITDASKAFDLQVAAVGDSLSFGGSLTLGSRTFGASTSMSAPPRGGPRGAGR